jgi:hypothetical protein
VVNLPNQARLKVRDDGAVEAVTKAGLEPNLSAMDCTNASGELEWMEVENVRSCWHHPPTALTRNSSVR